MQLSLKSTSAMWNISIGYFEAPQGYVIHSPRATPLLNKSHIPSLAWSNQYIERLTGHQKVAGSNPVRGPEIVFLR